MRLTQFGTVTLPQNNGGDSLPVQARTALVMLQNGAFDQDGNSMVFLPGSVSRQAVIITTIDTTLQALLAELGKGRNILKATLRDDTTEWQTFAKMQAVDRPALAATYDCQQAFVIQWSMSYPYWLHSADEPVFFDQGGTFDDGSFFDAGNVEEETITTTLHTFTITNNGDMPIPRGAIEIIPQGSATITNPRITNVTNGLWMEFKGTLTDTDRLVIDFLTKTVRKNGDDDYANFAIGASQQDWMVLEVGNNSIEISSDSRSGNVDLKWRWSRHYL